VRTLGLDRFSPPHRHGSSHGDTRITRLAIGEGAAYTPLAMRSHELWRELESETGEDLLTITGGLVMATRSGGTVLHHASGFFDQTVAAAQAFGIEHELLDAEEVRVRFPQFGLLGDERAYYEPGAGFLRPEACVRAQLGMAERHGAAVRRGERVSGYEAGDGRGVTVATDGGSYDADALVLACGSWIGELLPPELAVHFRAYRQLLHWFEIREDPAAFEPGRCPVYIWEFGPAAGDYVYGFPAVDGAQGGVKVAAEQYGAPADPEAIDRSVGEAEAEAMYGHYVRDRFPSLGPRRLRSAVCPYTVTPDWGFVLDRHPAHPEVFVASPCSGHGFKHSAAVGEAIAETLTEGKSSLDISPFGLGRLSA
jgi:sarcosine oxidase